MSKPGRKPSGEPYRLKGGGNWRVQIKGMGIIDLGTDDEQLAQVKAMEIMSSPRGVSSVVNSQRTPPTTSGVSSSIPTEQNLMKTEPTVRPDVIDNWLKTQTSEPAKQTELPLPKDVGSVATSPVATETSKPIDISWPNQNHSEFHSAPSASTPLTVINGGKKPKGPTPEQIEKLSKGLYKIATKVNIVAAEACVKFLGKDPCPLDDDEVELLQMGWEMQLNEWFGKSKPEPWMVLLAGNAAILFAMYVRGDDLPKKEKVSDVIPIA